MSVRVFALTCGWIAADLGQFLEGETGQVRIPVPSWLIEHPKGRLLFDSGLHPTTQTDPGSRLRGLVKIFHIQFAQGEEIDARLAALDIDAADIPLLINSHLHFDHAGGNARIPNARFVALEGRNHLILEDEPAWPRFLQEVEKFLAEDG